MLKIYGYNTFNVTKVLLTAEELGLVYEYQCVDLTKREQKEAAFLAIHPFGMLPAIAHDDKTLFESNTICRYLASLEPSKLYPDSLWERTVIDQWIDFMTSHLGKSLGDVYLQEVITRVIRRMDPDQVIITQAKTTINAQFPVLEKQLSEHQFLTSDDLTIADIIAFSFFTSTDYTSVGLEAYPNILRWYNRIKDSPAFTRAMGHFPGNKIVS